jgi:Ca-activated chloride channel family protein
MSFAAPNLLFALLLIPVAVIGYVVFERRRAARSGGWSRPALLPNIVRRPARRLRYLPAVLLLLGLTFLLVGFARPQRSLSTVSTIHGGGTTVALVMDTSGSMAATDVAPTRMQAANSLAKQFLTALPSKYRVALVTFGTHVRVVVPPTLNRKTVIAHLPDTVTPRAGTALGDAISEAVAVVVQAFGPSVPGRPYQPGALLLISDGAQTAGGTSPQNAALYARADGVPVNTVAIGTPRGIVKQPIEINNFKLTSTIPVPVDAAALAQVAGQTKGTAFPTVSAARAGFVANLKKVYENFGTRNLPGHREHSLSAAAGELALLFIIAGVVLSGLWFGRVA